MPDFNSTANPTVGMPGHDTMQEGAMLHGIQLRDSVIDLMDQ